jgi:FKBP-type peptidyl-prolyl cis-trans isomerase FkpA
MKKIVTIGLIFIIGISACKHAVKPNNPLLNIIEDKDGDTIKVDDFLSLTYIEKTEDGKLITDSYDYDMRPTLMFREKSYFKGDFFDMLGNLTEGDSAQFKISIDSIKNKMKRQLPGNITGKYLVYNVKVNNVINRGKLNDSAYNAAIEAYKKTAYDHAMQAEQGKIVKYISQNKLKPTKTASGLMYVITQKGNGPLPKQNDSVAVNYTAKTLTNKVFETTDKALAQRKGIFKSNSTYTPIKTPVLDKKQAVSGFLEAMALFPKGTKVTLVIPSKLAYGSGMHNMLQPYTPIICDMEVVDITPPKK